MRRSTEELEGILSALNLEQRCYWVRHAGPVDISFETVSAIVGGVSDKSMTDRPGILIFYCWVSCRSAAVLDL
jgi:hypothetical protein